MGACGCGDFNPQFKLAGPEGFVYTIELRQPCRDCATPAGIVITKLSDKEAGNCDVGEMPELPLVNIGPRGELWDYYLPVVFPGDLSDALTVFFGGTELVDRPFISDEQDACEILRDAMGAAAQREYQENRTKAADPSRE